MSLFILSTLPSLLFVDYVRDNAIENLSFSILLSFSRIITNYLFLLLLLSGGDNRRLNLYFTLFCRLFSLLLRVNRVEMNGGIAIDVGIFSFIEIEE